MKKYVIVEIQDTAGPYALQDAEGKTVRIGYDPRKLSAWAFDNGAQEVRHDEDLIKAENIPWTR